MMIAILTCLIYFIESNFELNYKRIKSKLILMSQNFILYYIFNIMFYNIFTFKFCAILLIFIKGVFCRTLAFFSTVKHVNIYLWTKCHVFGMKPNTTETFFRHENLLLWGFLIISWRFITLQLILIRKKFYGIVPLSNGPHYI